LPFLLAVYCDSDKNLNDKMFDKIQNNAKLANEAFSRSHKYVQGWLTHTDPVTGLIPRNLRQNKDIWNAWDSAADNYPFMVLTAALTNRDLFNGKMLDILNTEKKLTSRIGSLPDTYSFSKGGFNDDKPELARLIFGASEYIKDGLLPLTEWLGASPWSDRMIEMLDDIWQNAPVETKYGNIPSTSQEVNGEMLQVLSRVYWMTGNKKYLDFATRLGDYYLFDFHPTRDGTLLRLRDHGCEILSGLTELYATVSYVLPDKKEAYKGPVHAMLDRVLEIGRNEHGMLYNTINPQTGEHHVGLCDTWGYNYNGFYTVYLLDGTNSYRDAVLLALSNLNLYYRDYDWEHGSADGDADATESAINLYNREPVASVADWIDNQIQVMWAKQQENGIIEGWHGDGNFARTSIMYALWKTKGLTVEPWNSDIYFGAEFKGNKLYISIGAETSQQCSLVFDRKRFSQNLHLPVDYPRINQFPEWFTIEADKNYYIKSNFDLKSIYSGRELESGLEINLRPGTLIKLIISEK